MKMIRRSAERGLAQHDWLKSYHTFSFDTYVDPKWVRFRTLRVINEDWIAAASGFAMHPHRDMEIVTYVISGTLHHEDSLGNAYAINAGDVQVMSAGTGIVHGEANQSTDTPVHLLQIWILPEVRSLQPGYAQRHFTPEEKRDHWRCLASASGAEDSLVIHQDARIMARFASAGEELHYKVESGRGVWFQVVSGGVRVDRAVLAAGDALGIEGEDLQLTVTHEAELVLFDVV